MNSKFKLHIQQLRLTIILACIPIIFSSIYLGFKLNQFTNKRAEIKSDFSQVNDIYYGLLSVDLWEIKVEKILSNQIKNFTLTRQQDSIIQLEISEILYDAISKSQNMINENNTSFKHKVRKIAVNTFVDVDKVKAKVPVFSKAIIDKATTPESKARIENLVLSKLEELAGQTYDSLSTGSLNTLMEKYGIVDKVQFNTVLKQQINDLQNKAKIIMLWLIALVIIFSFVWIVLPNNETLLKTFFLFSVLLALIILIAGVTSPMIEIGAKISQLQFKLLGEYIEFNDQIIFYRSKSIVEMVLILFKTMKLNMILVGFLILSFSIIIPMLKLLFMGIYLLNKKIRKIKIVAWLVNYSGKWSMADVIVVAIFMSYIAFDGIIKDQLSSIDKHTETINAITTNETDLDAGFYIFLTYVIYSLFLSSILKWIVKKESENSNKELLKI
jgi:hypothetical protein